MPSPFILKGDKPRSLAVAELPLPIENMCMKVWPTTIEGHCMATLRLKLTGPK